MRDRIAEWRKASSLEAKHEPKEKNRSQSGRKRKPERRESSVSSKSSKKDDFLSTEHALEGNYFDQLKQKREYFASDCVSRLSKEMGLRSETDGFTGTFLPHLKPTIRQTDLLWRKLRQNSDTAWSDVALKEGIQMARSGKYEDAISSYGRALNLNPRSCDAFVARGAAFANQGNYGAALDDFEKALDIRPGDRNAQEYKQKVSMRKLERETRKQPTKEHKDALQYRQGLSIVQRAVRWPSQVCLEEVYRYPLQVLPKMTRFVPLMMF